MISMNIFKSENLNSFNSYLMYMTIQIKDFEMSMYEEVRALWIKVGFKLSKSDEREKITHLLNHNPGLLIVAKKENIIIGSVLGTTDGRRGYIYHLAIDPAFHKQNVGSELIEELFKRFKNQDIDKVHGFVLTSNEAVTYFYEQHGCYRRSDLFVMSRDL